MRRALPPRPHVTAAGGRWAACVSHRVTVSGGGRPRQPPPAPASRRFPRPFPSFPPAGGRSRSPHKLVINLATGESGAESEGREGRVGVGGGWGKGLNPAGLGLAAAAPLLPARPPSPQRRRQGQAPQRRPGPCSRRGPQSAEGAFPGGAAEPSEARGVVLRPLPPSPPV